MKLHALLSVCWFTLGCASAPARAPESVRLLTPRLAGAPDATPAQPTERIAVAEPVAASEPDVAERPPGEPASAEESVSVSDNRDPLAVGDAFEAWAVPTIEITPAAQLRKTTPAQLKAAMRFASSVARGDAAARELTCRLGEPSWTEAPRDAPASKRRVWVAEDAGSRCHRLVLEADGTVAVESASTTEWRMLTALSHQNPCTGEMKHGF